MNEAVPTLREAAKDDSVAGNARPALPSYQLGHGLGRLSHPVNISLLHIRKRSLVFSHIFNEKNLQLTSSRFSSEVTSNHPGILKPRLSVMGITGAVGQITWTNSHLTIEYLSSLVNTFKKVIYDDTLFNMKSGHLEVVRSDGVEKRGPAVSCKWSVTRLWLDGQLYGLKLKTWVPSSDWSVV